MAKRTSRIKPSELRLDPRLQTRVHVPEEIIEDYRDLLRSGTRFPPVAAVRVAGVYYVTDGFCRVTAASIEEVGLVDVQWEDGQWEDAVRAACGANAEHGLRRTRADKERAATLALEQWPTMSDSLLAAIARVSRPYIATIRKRVHGANTLPDDEEPEETEADAEQAEAEETEAAASETPAEPQATPQEGGCNVAPPKPKKASVTATAPESETVAGACIECGDERLQKNIDGTIVCRTCLAPQEQAKPKKDVWAEVPKAVSTSVGKLVRELEKAGILTMVRKELDALNRAIQRAM